jgi:uncharacterized protein (DUF58 family)
MALTNTSAMGRVRATATALANNSIESIITGPQDVPTESPQRAAVAATSSHEDPAVKARKLQEKKDSFAKVSSKQGVPVPLVHVE